MSDKWESLSITVTVRKGDIVDVLDDEHKKAEVVGTMVNGTVCAKYVGTDIYFILTGVTFEG